MRNPIFAHHLGRASGTEEHRIRPFLRWCQLIICRFIPPHNQITSFRDSFMQYMHLIHYYWCKIGLFCCLLTRCCELCYRSARWQYNVAQIFTTRWHSTKLAAHWQNCLRTLHVYSVVYGIQCYSHYEESRLLQITTIIWITAECSTLHNLDECSRHAQLRLQFLVVAQH